MTEQTSAELTIFFADICRSTVLFEEIGDQAALNLIMEALRQAEEIAKENNGKVIGTIGDEVMCTFITPEDALITAQQIHSAMQASNSMQEHQLAMRVGINSGSVVNVGNSVYGDSVNTAARLAQLAKANQSLISATTIESVTESLHEQLRRVGQISLQGKSGMAEVFELLVPHAKEAITEVATIKENPSRSFLMTAKYRSRQMRFDPLLVRFLFGRGIDCDQVIDHPTISREHAEFQYKNGQFLLRDFSTNGSVIVRENKIERVHRTSLELNGNGKIYLGRTMPQQQFCIEYTCISGR